MDPISQMIGSLYFIQRYTRRIKWARVGTEAVFKYMNTKETLTLAIIFASPGKGVDSVLIVYEKLGAELRTLELFLPIGHS